MRQLLAYAMYAGGVIGVGVFGLPYAVAQAGLLPAIILWLVVLAVVWVSHLAYADVVLHTKGKHRLPGYVSVYLGRPGFAITALTNTIGLVGALLAYALIGGTFLAFLLAPVVAVTPAVATLGYFIVGALLLFRGVRALPFVQLVVLGLFSVTIVSLALAVFPAFSLMRIPLLGPPRTFSIPYGILLFSFWGLSLIPEVTEMVRGKWGSVRRVLTWSLATATASYVIFTLLIVGVTGVSTAEDALSTLADTLGRGPLVIGAIYAVLTTLSSFIPLGLTLIRTLSYDFHLRPLPAWGIAMAAPPLLFLLGVQQFVRVLSVTGAVFLGVEGLLVLGMFLAAHRRVRTHRGVLMAPAVVILCGLLLLAGVVAEVFRSSGVLGPA